MVTEPYKRNPPEIHPDSNNNSMSAFENEVFSGFGAPQENDKLVSINLKFKPGDPLPDGHIGGYIPQSFAKSSLGQLCKAVEELRTKDAQNAREILLLHRDIASLQINSNWQAGTIQELQVTIHALQEETKSLRQENLSFTERLAALENIILKRP